MNVTKITLQVGVRRSWNYEHCECSVSEVLELSESDKGYTVPSDHEVIVKGLERLHVIVSTFANKSVDDAIAKSRQRIAEAKTGRNQSTQSNDKSNESAIAPKEG